MSNARVLSCDSHIVEPPDLWTARVAADMRSRVPHLERHENGDVYVCEDLPLAAVSMLSAAGKAGAWHDQPARWEDAILPGAYDPDARIEDMDADGIDAEVVYPTIALRMFAIPDQPLRLAVFHAYNDWVAEYCQAHPARIKGIAMVDTEDLDEGVAELNRARSLDLVGAMVSINPQGNAYVEAEFDRFWATAAELGLPVSLHINTNREKLRLATPGDSMTIPTFVQRTLANLIFGGVFLRHPRLRVVSAENDAGWAPYFLQRMDGSFERHRTARKLPIDDGGLQPSEYFQRNVRLTFMEDAVAIRHRVEIGLDCLAWASDYPHKESTFPHSQSTLDDLFRDVPDGERNQIVAGNTAALYGL